MKSDSPNSAIAVIGLSCRFPGCDSPAEYWSALAAGRDCISDLTAIEALAAGVSKETLNDRNYVLKWGVLRDAEMFDAAFFAFTPLEAQIADPQQRVFLELVSAALEDAGYGDPQRRPLTGIYAAAGNSGYARMVDAVPGLRDMAGEMLIEIGNSPEHVAARAAHKLNLHGPVLTVQTACSSALAAAHAGRLALLCHECDMAVVGAISMKLPQNAGYTHEPGGISSADGQTRSFDERADGTVGGNGGGVVVLRRLADAIAAGDDVRAVILGSAINNDGGRRAGYAAPSIDGQETVIRAAVAAAGVVPATIGFIECHGSGTRLGDAVELTALSRVFAAGVDERGVCVLGSAKSNLGHLREAAGMAGLIKTILALQNGLIPPSLHFQHWNNDAKIEPDHLVVGTGLTQWPIERQSPRRAGVSSFGLGGTNVHMVLEQPPPAPARTEARPGQLLPLSARTELDLGRQCENMSLRLEGVAARDLADAAFVLQQGRRHFPFRHFVVASDGNSAAQALRAARKPPAPVTAAPEVAFLLAGTGDGYRGLASGLYQSEPDFRRVVDECIALAQPWLSRDLHAQLALRSGRQCRVPGDLNSLLRAARAPVADSSNLTVEEQHCADFIVVYSLAQFWRAAGIEPNVLLGYSLGEYVAAALAGMFELSDALRIVIARAALIGSCDDGGMLVICDLIERLASGLPDGVEIAAVNAANLTTVAGPASRLDVFQKRLADEGVAVRRLPTCHAIHTSAMAAPSKQLATVIGSLPRRPPSLQIISNVTAAPLTATEALDVDHWVHHLTSPVQMGESIQRLIGQGVRLFIEIGPGQVWSSVVNHADRDRQLTAVSSLPAVHDLRDDRVVFLNALSRCWAAGASPNWDFITALDRPCRVPLPAYALNWQRHTVPQSVNQQQPTAPQSVAVSERPPAAATSHARCQNIRNEFESETELAVSELFSLLIGGGQVFREDNFFEIGGHSLLAVQLLASLRKTFEKELTLSTLYRNPTVAELARWIELCSAGAV